jgi:hypothetical protein
MTEFSERSCATQRTARGFDAALAQQSVQLFASSAGVDCSGTARLQFSKPLSDAADILDRREASRSFCSLGMRAMSSSASRLGNPGGE